MGDMSPARMMILYSNQESKKCFDADMQERLVHRMVDCAVIQKSVETLDG
jgi:rhamnose utilization protein RhaD (predicted bifunctional aldolase and dehydrogenase)